MGAIATGEDPHVARREAREARNFGDLVAWYLQAPGKRKRKETTRDQ